MAKEISTTGILLILLLSFIVLSQMESQATIVSVKISDGKISSAGILNATVKNANKWFNSYPSGQYSIFISYDNKQLRVSNIDSKSVLFYLDDSPDCVNVQLYWTSALVDTKRACK